ncbi:MAG: lysophospholipase [Ruminococcus sp.]|nr:lysophospholipase [Ruminococcus sp.]
MILKKFLSALAGTVIAFSGAGMMSTYADNIPNEIISRNCPAYSGNENANPSFGNDEHYFSFWQSSSPDYLAYDLSGVKPEYRKKVIAVWYNTSAYDNIGMYVNRNMEPSDYTIEVNSAKGGEYPADGWEVVETVEGNTLSSRQHVVDMEGYNWIRINIQKADDETGKQASINFDVHNVSEGITDSWIFFGDSITAGGMNNCYGTGFATHVNMIDGKYFPIQENGGIGGIRSIDGKENIDRWLSTCPAKYVSIAYGTNDAWGNPGATEEYYSNTKYMIDKIIELGKVPVLPKIPSSTNADVKDNVPLYNAKVEQLYEEYGEKLVHGPDFAEFFVEHPDYLSADGVHPNDTGYAEMRKLWAETMYKNVYTAENTDTPEDDILYGDANDDGRVSISDAVAILQHLANSSKYGLSKGGLSKGDVYNRGDGITGKDAYAITLLDAKVIDKLPITGEE